MKEKIEKFLDYTYNNKLVHILIIIIVTLALSLHMKEFQIYDTHDGPFHLLRILDTNKQLKNGIFPAIIGIALTIINLPLLIKEKKINKNYLLFLMFIFLCIWMSIESFPWLKMPKILTKLQFPWRMIGFGSFFIAFVAGINYCNILEKLPSLYFLKIILIIALISSAVINSMKISKNLKTWGVFKDKEIEKSWEDKNWTIFTNYDFAPTKAKTEIMTGYKILMTIYSDSNKLKVENEKVTDKLIYTAKVENLQKGDTIWVPYLYYPYYELKIIDGENEILKQRPTESKDGMIQFKINEKISREAKLEIYYKPTAIVIVSYYGALLSTIALIVYIIIFKFKMKKFNTQ